MVNGNSCAANLVLSHFLDTETQSKGPLWHQPLDPVDMGKGWVWSVILPYMGMFGPKGKDRIITNYKMVKTTLF